MAAAALEHEHRLAESDTALTETRGRIEEFELLLVRIDAARQGLPERLTQLDAELTGHTAAAGALESAEARLS